MMTMLRVWMIVILVAGVGAAQSTASCANCRSGICWDSVTYTGILFVPEYGYMLEYLAYTCPNAFPILLYQFPPAGTSPYPPVPSGGYTGSTLPAGTGSPTGLPPATSGPPPAGTPTPGSPPIATGRACAFWCWSLAVWPGAPPAGITPGTPPYTPIPPAGSGGGTPAHGSEWPLGPHGRAPAAFPGPWRGTHPLGGTPVIEPNPPAWPTPTPHGSGTPAPGPDGPAVGPLGSGMMRILILSGAWAEIPCPPFGALQPGDVSVMFDENEIPVHIATVSFVANNVVFWNTKPGLGPFQKDASDADTWGPYTPSPLVWRKKICYRRKPNY